MTMKPLRYLRQCLKTRRHVQRAYIRALNYYYRRDKAIWKAVIQIHRRHAA